MTEATVNIFALRAIQYESIGRRCKCVIGIHERIGDLGLPHIPAGSPCAVTDMAAALFTGLLGQVPGPSLCTVDSEWLKVDIVTVSLPEHLDDVEVLAGSVDNQVMVEATAGMVPLRDSGIHQLLPQSLAMVTEAADKVIQPLVCKFPAVWEILVPIGQGHHQIVTAEV